MQHAYGAAWYWNPARWGTSDGYVPYAMAVHAFASLQGHEARARLSMLRALQLSQVSSASELQQHIREDVRLAEG